MLIHTPTLDFPGSLYIVQVLRFWAGLESRQTRDIVYARQLYNEVVKKASDDYLAWLEYIDLERYAGEPDKARTLFRRVSQVNILDGVLRQRSWSDWIAFEREVGSLDQLLHATEQCRIKESEWRYFAVTLW